MSVEEAQEKTMEWATATSAADSPSDKLAELWQGLEPTASGRDLHQVVIQSFAAIDPQAEKLIAILDPLSPPLVAPDLDDIARQSTNEFFQTNLSLYVARFLTDAKMYEEALELFEQSNLTLAVDPATALFYRAVCEHQLLMKKEGLASIQALLNESAPIPESYSAVAQLMKSELESLEDDSLEEIAGLMRDVERRLELARGGQRVQKKEEAITSKLDEMIKKIEEQMSQSSSSSGGGSGGQNQSSNPLGDSIVKGSTAPGEVDEKDVRRGGGWGDLPPREREQAKNEIERAFPSNYSRLINEYFLKRSQTSRSSPSN